VPAHAEWTASTPLPPPPSAAASAAALSTTIAPTTAPTTAPTVSTTPRRVRPAGAGGDVVEARDAPSPKG